MENVGGDGAPSDGGGRLRAAAGAPPRAEGTDVEVIALVGASGTGKSHRAAGVAAAFGATALVDDGLVIVGGNIVAGRSAKREATRMAAVRRAIFQRDEDAQAARRALAEAAPERVLVIGTSRSMVDRIIARLGLPPPARIVAIEEVAAPEEISIARHVRRTEGKHVIPAPTLQVKRGFSGYLVDPLRLLFRAGPGRAHEVEKSIVRPTYSALGRFSIDDRAVAQVAAIAARQGGAARVHRVGVRPADEGVRLALELDLGGATDLLGRMAALQTAVAREVERLTALNVLAVDVHLKAVDLPRRALRARSAPVRPRGPRGRDLARGRTPKAAPRSAGPSGPRAGWR
jgi:hypothetical protein